MRSPSKRAVTSGRFTAQLAELLPYSEDPFPICALAVSRLFDVGLISGMCLFVEVELIDPVLTSTLVTSEWL